MNIHVRMDTDWIFWMLLPEYPFSRFGLLHNDDDDVNGFHVWFMTVTW